MSRYSAGWTKAAPGAGTFVTQMRAGATRDIRVWEVGIFNTTAVASSIGLIRAASVGATFTSITPVADEPSAGAAAARVDTAATTAPTISTNVYMRQITIPATVGGGVIWSFPNGIAIDPNAGLLLWNFGGAAAAALAGYWSYDE